MATVTWITLPPWPATLLRDGSGPVAMRRPGPRASRRECLSGGGSLHGDGLGEVARLVDVVTHGRRQLAGEELERELLDLKREMDGYLMELGYGA